MKEELAYLITTIGTVGFPYRKKKKSGSLPLHHGPKKVFPIQIPGPMVALLGCGTLSSLKPSMHLEIPQSTLLTPWEQGLWLFLSLNLMHQVWPLEHIRNPENVC